MNLQNVRKNGTQGYTLLLTLGFVSICLILVASVCRLATTQGRLSARNTAFNNAVFAAESATEVVIARMNRDFRYQSLSQDTNHYTGVVPTAYLPQGWTGDYEFTDTDGNSSRCDVICNGWQVQTNFDATSEYKGLYGTVNSFEITSTARRTTGLHPVAATVRQSIELKSIPLFQFAIFYTTDLEINPGAPMVVTGKTHGNANIYAAPGDSLEFLDSVTAVGNIFHRRRDGDPTSQDNRKTPIYHGGREEGVSSLTLPVGTDNAPSNVVAIVDSPDFGEDPMNELGRQRYYNKSDLVITTTDKGVEVKYNHNEEGQNFSAVPTNIIAGTIVNGVPSCGYSFINTNASFYDYRERKTVIGTEIDVRALMAWLKSQGASYNLLAEVQTGHLINSLFVEDKRKQSGKLTAVRVVNGQDLPGDGLTVATPLPLYVLGHFNAPDLTPGSTNTSSTKPASLVSDAITILSKNWSDAYNKDTPLGDRRAADVTVNAAFLSGIVETTKTDDGGEHYSGGVENFPRFLENWGGTSMTYNGSMVVMFASRHAKSFWNAPGNYYNPPKRLWAFDRNFLDSTKLPPGTPQVRVLGRSKWSIIAAKAPKAAQPNK